MKTSLIGGSLSACLFVSAVAASENADIVVEIEDRRPVAASQVSSLIDVIYRQDIEESGTSSLIEYFQTHTNVQISGASSGIDQSGTIDLRGFGERAAENVLILLNGRVLNNVSTETPDLSSIPIQSIERIEILNGSAGVLYGDGAVGGVINIITNQVANRSSADFGTGSFGLVETAVNLSDTLDNGHQLALRLNAKTADGYRDYSEFEQSHGGIAYSIPLQSGVTTVGIEQTRTDGFLSGVVESTVLDADRRAFRGASVQDKTSILRTIWAQIRSDFGTQNDFLIDVSRRLSHQEGTGGVLSSPYSIDQLLTTNTISPSLVRKTKIFGKQANVMIGSDYTFGEFRTGSNAIRSQKNTSLFARSEVKITSTESVTVGARSTQSTDRLLVGTEVEHTVQSFEIGFERQTKLGIFSARLDENFRLATVDEQVAYPDGITATDTPISPQTGRSYELGWRGTNSSVAIYSLKNRNEIFYNPATFTNTTVGTTSRYGMNASHEYQVMNGTSIENSLNLNRAKFDEGIYAGKTVPAISELSYTLKIRRNFANGFTAIWSTRYLSPQYSINDWANTSDKRNGYTTSNMTIGKRLEGLDIQVTIKNVFDSKYDHYHLISGGTLFRSPADPRAFAISATYDF